MATKTWSNPLISLWEHLLYPVSHPNQVLLALGIASKMRLNFRQFLQQIVTRSPKRLYRRMSRSQSEKVFSNAYKKETFHHMTLISYYFCQGWLEFILEFDPRDNLRRLYVQHRMLNANHSIELELLEVDELTESQALPASETTEGLEKPMAKLLHKLFSSKR